MLIGKVFNAPTYYDKYVESNSLHSEIEKNKSEYNQQIDKETKTKLVFSDLYAEIFIRNASVNIYMYVLQDKMDFMLIKFNIQKVINIDETEKNILEYKNVSTQISIYKNNSRPVSTIHVSAKNYLSIKKNLSDQTLDKITESLILYHQSTGKNIENVAKIIICFSFLSFYINTIKEKIMLEKTLDISDTKIIFYNNKPILLRFVINANMK
ncbi:MAG: hypothetical protein QXF12_05270 [Candidatus Aenigmatarchaeota archaeon]